MADYGSDYVDISDFGSDIGDEFVDISGDNSGQPVEEAPADPYVSDRDRGFLSNTAAGIGRGLVGLVGLGAESLEAMGLDNSVDDWAKSAPEKYDFLKRSESDYNGEGSWFTKAMRSVPESVTTSLGAMAPGAAAGAALGSGFFGIGAVPGAIAGGMLSTLGLFGVGTGHQKFEEARAKGMSYDDSLAYGLKYGAVEGGLEAAASGLDIATGKVGGTILKTLMKQGAKGTAREVLQSVGKGTVRAMAETQIAEGLTEQAQLDLEGRIDSEYGVGEKATWEDRAETAMTTAAMSLIVGGVLSESPRAMKRRAQSLLESGDQVKMQAGSDLIYDKLKEDGDKDLAEAWDTYAKSYINNGKTIDLDGNYVEIADKIQYGHKTTVEDLISDNPEVRRNAEEKAFKSIGIHPDGTQMTEEEHKEFQDKAAEVFTERATAENKARNNNDEDGTSALNSVKTKGGDTMLRDAVQSTKNGIAGEATVTGSEKLAIQSQKTERSDITPELEKTDEIFKKQKEEEDALAAKRQRAVDYALKLQDEQRAAMLKAHDNNEAITMGKEVNDAVAKAQAAHEAWMKKKEQNKRNIETGTEMQQKSAAQAAAKSAVEESIMLGNEEATAVAKANAAKASNQEVAKDETERDKRKSESSSGRSGRSGSRTGTGSIGSEEVGITSGKPVAVVQGPEKVEAPKRPLKSKTKVRSTIVRTKTAKSNRSEAVPTAQLKIGDKVGTAPTAAAVTAAKEKHKLEGKRQAAADITAAKENKTAATKKTYTEATRDVVDTMTPEKSLDLKQQAEAVPVSDESVRDLKEVQTEDPVVRALADGNVEELKRLASPGKKGGNISAKKVRAMLDKAVSDVIQDPDNTELGSQARYAADEIDGKILERPAAKKSTAWNKGETADIATGTTPEGKEVMVAPATSGKGYSVYTREKGGKWSEEPGSHKTVSEGMKSFDKQFKDNSGFKKVGTRTVSDNHEVTIHKSNGSDFVIEQHKRGTTRFWTVADKNGERIPKTPQFKTKSQVIEQINKLESGEEVDGNSNPAFQALAESKSVPGLNNGKELLESVKDNGSSTWNKLVSKLYLKMHGKALEGIQVRSITKGAAFHRKGVIYINEKFLDRPDIITHELTHALTVNALDENTGGFRGKVNYLLRQAKDELLTKDQADVLNGIHTSKDWMTKLTKDERAKLMNETDGAAYGLINEKEFLANIHDRPSFRDALNTIFPGNMQGKSILGKLKNAIQKLLGINDASLLDQVFSVTNEIAAVNHMAGMTKSQYVDATIDFSQYISKDKSIDTLNNLKKQVEKTIKPISIRIGEISPKVAMMIRKMDFRIHDQEQQMLNKVTPWKNKYEKLSKVQRQAIDKAWNNYSMAPGAMLDLMKQHSMVKEFNDVLKVTDDILKKYRGVGLDPYKTMSNFLPRRVKDINALSAYLSKSPDADGQIAAMLSNNKLSEAEKLEELNRMINHGSFPEAALRRPDSMRNRSIKVVNTKMTNEFYHSAPEAIMMHISDSVDKIETRRLLVPKGLPAMERRLRSIHTEIKNISRKKGRKNVPRDLLDQRDQLEATLNKLIQADETAISAMLLDEAKGLKDSEIKELVDMIRARLNQKGTRGLTMTLKNMGLVTALGSPLSTITQIGDIAWSIHQHGMSNTVKAMLKKKEITREDMNFDSAIREFQTSGSSKLVEKVLSKTLFSKMDGWMKQVNMDAALLKYRSQTVDEFTKQNGKLFNNPQKVYEDIKAGNITEDVRYLLFCNIADMQPVAMSEMPERYLTAGNGRIFYTLKSYSIKAMSNIMHEAFDSTKSTPQKVRSAMQLAFIVVMANAGTDLLKDMLLGRDADPGDEVIDNLLKLFMLSKYSMSSLKRSGPSQLVIDQLSPPILRTADDMYMDVASWLNSDKDNTFKTMRNIPFVGKLAYELGTVSAKKSELKRMQSKAKGYKDDHKPVPAALRRRINDLKIKIRQGEK